MKIALRLACINLMCLSALPVFAEVIGPGANLDPSKNQGQSRSGGQELPEYLLNLGSYLGFDLKKAPPTTGNEVPFSKTLIDISLTQLNEYYLLNSSLGAIPVNTLSAALSNFLPAYLSGASLINSYANTTFAKPAYNTQAQQQGTLSINPLIDQKTYQKDPVSQAVLNILTTPDYTQCMDDDTHTLKGNCPYLFQNKVISGVIGQIPHPDKFYSYDYNQQLVSQVNINSLLAPMMYSTEDAANSTTTGESADSTNKGLVAQSQAQQAANFIRYATGTVVPITQPKQKTYVDLYLKAISKNPEGATGPSVEKMTAQNVLNTYFANLRIYAAQSSVGLGNLYYILSKRMPQNQGGGGYGNPTSQALSEYTMATWRLKAADPNKPNDTTWVERINKASSATVQKEIALLLAEMNYQMYLTRQQDERLLLTQSLLLIQNTKANQPAIPDQGTGPTPQ